jgi:hypothetical protein
VVEELMMPYNKDFDGNILIKRSVCGMVDGDR